MNAIRIFNDPRCLVHKTETYKNLLAVSKGRKWAGKWYGCVQTKQTTFATREEAEKEVARLEALGKSFPCFTCPLTYTIVEL